MKTLLYFAFSMFLFSCKDSVNELPDPFIEPTKIANTDKVALYDQVLKIDTLVLEKLNKLNIADKVLAVTLKTGFSKDSIEITSCRIDFYFKNKLIQSFPVQTYTSHEDPIWSFYEDVFTNQKSNKSDNRFFEISYGVPACGFTQSNFLFFVENNEFQLVTKYNSVADGPYGNYFEFNPYFVGDDVLYFASKRVTIDVDESKPYNDENEDLVITFTDSTIYKLYNGKWLGQLKTHRNKPYRKEFKNYKELYQPE